MPTKNYQRFENNLDETSRGAKSWKIKNLTDATVDEISVEKRSIKTTEPFLKSGSLFNCEEKGKTLLSVIF